jgi:starch synthase
MMNASKTFRILIVTPEITYLPNRPHDFGSDLQADVGALADMSSALVMALLAQDADVHVAIPEYRQIFKEKVSPYAESEDEYDVAHQSRRIKRIHLAKDSIFNDIKSFYSNQSPADAKHQNLRLALTFQREVINNIIPRVKPDLIHCNDWMTALVPAMARKEGIPCLFTLHNFHTVKTTVSRIMDNGIYAEDFWRYLYFERLPEDFEQARDNNPIDFLSSGIFAAHFVNTPSPTFLQEVVEGKHPFIDEAIRVELRNKFKNDCAFGILNAPDPSFKPVDDKFLRHRYTAESHERQKELNKLELQKELGLIQDESAPLFFWPSRLDPYQKGCQLLADILFEVISRYAEHRLQIVFVASGEYFNEFKKLVKHHDLSERVAIHDFSERLEHQAYAASDFILMPSRYEPCGLPQMIAPIYGSLPVAHDTGGIHDTVSHLDLKRHRGNGFLFKVFDSAGLFWAIGEAIKFYDQPKEIKFEHIRRIMSQSQAFFNYEVVARQYINLYEKMLQRPLISDMD